MLEGSEYIVVGCENRKELCWTGSIDKKNPQIFKYSKGKAPVINYFVFFSFNISYIPKYSFVCLSNYVKRGFSTTTVTFIWAKVCVYLLTF